MKTNNAIVNALLSVEDLDHALHSHRRHRRFMARAAITVVLVAVVVFYSAEVTVNLGFASFLLSLIVDSGVSILAFWVLLLLPVETALGTRDFRNILRMPSSCSEISAPSDHGINVNTLLIPNPTAHMPPTEEERDETPNDQIDVNIQTYYGTTTASPASPASVTGFSEASTDDIESIMKLKLGTYNDGTRMTTSMRTSMRASILPAIDLSPNDKGLTIHACVFIFCVVSSCISEDVVVYTDRSPNINVKWAVLFLLADVIQNLLYCGAFFHLAIAYRVLACRIWSCREELIRSSSLSGRDNKPSRLFKLVGRQRADYEATYKDSESLSSRTGVVAMLLVGLVTVEMVSVLVHGNFDQFEFDVAHLAAMRHLLVLMALLLQLALASADIMYASRRFAAAMAALEGQVREDYGNLVIYGPTGINNDIEPQQLQVLADLLKTVSKRVSNFPVRIAVSWFKFTTDWAAGVVFLAGTVLLAVIGVKMP